MTTKEILTLPQYYDRYINLVEPELSIIDALKKYGVEYLLNQRYYFEELEDAVYAEGKWTIKQILQHIIDTERIFTYRALWFARHDSTPLPGYNEVEYANNDKVMERSLDDVLEEFEIVRESTIALFKSFDTSQIMASGTASSVEISVLAIGFTIVGHVMHHLQVIKERYYPLIDI